MGTIFTVAVYLFGTLFLAYVIACEFLDTVGRLEIIEARWPRLYKAMSNRPMRLVLVIFLIALVGKDIVDRAKEKLTVPTLIVEVLAPPAPVVQFQTRDPKPAKQKTDPSAVITTRQSAIDNEGSIGTMNFDDNTVSGVSNGEIVIDKNVKVGSVDISGNHFCELTAWECLLTEVLADSGKPSSIQTDVNAFLIPQMPQINTDAKCESELRSVVQMIMKNTSDERATVDYLRPRQPTCVVTPR